MSNKAQDLIVKRGLIVFNSASFTEIPECTLDIYDNPDVQGILGNMCNEQGVTGDTQLITRKPDGTICYLRCR